MEKDKIIEEYKKLLKLKDLKIDEMEEEKHEIEAKFHQIEEEKYEMEENQKIQNEKKVPLSIILNGLPKFKFRKFNESKSASKTAANPTPYTSKREKIHIKKKLKIIPQNIEDLKLNMKKINLNNSKFFDKNTYFKEKIIRYSSENTIQRLVYDYMTDIFDILELTEYVNLFDTPSIVTAISEDELKKMNYPDVIIIRTKKNKPIIAIEIKKPHEDNNGKNVLNDDNVIGLDYMLSIKSFYNQKHVYGILTSLSGWKILSLPEEDEIDFNSRIVYESKIYDFSDPNLAKILITIINKSLDSAYYPIKIFDEKRNYIEYSLKGCRWKRMDKKELNSLDKNINLDIYKNCEKLTYTIYKFFQTGRTNQTSLIINNCCSIGVLKQFFGDEENKEEFKIFKHEAKMWKKIYNINTEIQVINDKPTFITPLIFTLEEQYNSDYEHYEVFFRTDLMKIFTYEGAIEGELSISLRTIQSKINTYSQDMNILESAKYAINELAKKNYIHKDLKWEHIGLYPILKNGIIVKMEPIFIDLESIKKKKMEKAEERMMEKLDIMCENRVFINNK
uniref:Protein kinase domain-containing protein n=1 Tax=viral metagenome TaxID=1070528 RepID=A0A6C0AE11_9ZZZZ